MYRMPVQGPSLQGEPPLPEIIEKYTAKGYADDVKACIRSMDEFLLLDFALTIFEAASGCAVHRDVNQDKCKVLLLGNWKRLQQEDIPVRYLKISDCMDMLGLTLMSTFTTTRKANGDIIKKKYSDKVNPWRAGRFMPINERSHSINTYALSRVWYKAHCIPLRIEDINHINATTRKWLLADLLVKPSNLVCHRKKENGGLNLTHVKSKCLATLIKSFIETASNPKYIKSYYHYALLAWNVYEDYSIPDPGKNPYFNTEFYNKIKEAILKEKNISKMTCKEWYSFILQSELEETGPNGENRLIPCRVELKLELHDWSQSWRLARLKGLSSQCLSFLWKLLHELLPTKERQNRILRNGNGANCAICGETDNIIHALATCRKSSPVFNWVKHGLDLFCSDLTTEKILLLDIKINTPLPHNELPVIWFLSTALSKLWEQREAGRRCQLEEIKAYVIAKNNHVKHSKFNDMSIIIDQMITV